MNNLDKLASVFLKISIAVFLLCCAGMVFRLLPAAESVSRYMDIWMLR
jgi:hypothetical protein